MCRWDGTLVKTNSDFFYFLENLEIHEKFVKN